MGYLPIDSPPSSDAPPSPGAFDWRHVRCTRTGRPPRCPIRVAKRVSMMSSTSPPRWSLRRLLPVPPPPKAAFLSRGEGRRRRCALARSPWVDGRQLPDGPGSSRLRLPPYSRDARAAATTVSRGWLVGHTSGEGRRSGWTGGVRPGAVAAGGRMPPALRSVAAGGRTLLGQLWSPPQGGRERAARTAEVRRGGWVAGCGRLRWWRLRAGAHGPRRVGRGRAGEGAAGSRGAVAERQGAARTRRARRCAPPRGHRASRGPLRAACGARPSGRSSAPTWRSNGTIVRHSVVPATPSGCHRRPEEVGGNRGKICRRRRRGDARSARGTPPGGPGASGGPAGPRARERPQGPGMLRT